MNAARSAAAVTCVPRAARRAFPSAVEGGLARAGSALARGCPAWRVLRRAACLFCRPMRPLLVRTRVARGVEDVTVAYGDTPRGPVVGGSLAEPRAPVHARCVPLGACLSAGDAAEVDRWEGSERSKRSGAPFLALGCGRPRCFGPLHLREGAYPSSEDMKPFPGDHTPHWWPRCREHVDTHLCPRPQGMKYAIVDPIWVVTSLRGADDTLLPRQKRLARPPADANPLLRKAAIAGCAEALTKALVPAASKCGKPNVDRKPLYRTCGGVPSTQT